MCESSYTQTVFLLLTSVVFKSSPSIYVINACMGASMMWYQIDFNIADNAIGNLPVSDRTALWQQIYLRQVYV